MDPITAVTLITSGIPFLTLAIKKVLQTHKLEDQKRAGINALIPIIIGILSVGLYTYQQSHDWKVALVAGLGSGGAASSVRDIDKNLVGIVETLFKLFGKKTENAG